MNDTVLEFDDVSLQDPLGKGVALQHAKLSVRKSDLLLLVTDAARGYCPFTDMALGLIEPEAGEIRVFGRGWPNIKPSKAEEYRGKIGHIFPEGQGWVSNLTVEENISLSARHHTSLPDRDIYDRICKRMDELGCPSQMLEMRPEETNGPDLRMADWIRAFVVERALFILENPMVGVVPEKGICLKRWIGEARDRGAAVISIVSDSAGWLDMAGLMVRYWKRDGIISMEENKNGA